MARPARLQRLKRVLVPVSDPKTAPSLLRAAASLVTYDKGELVAVTIGGENTEDDSELRDELTPAISELREQGWSIRFVSRLNSSVTRGILDLAREIRADAILVGQRRDRKGAFDLSTIVEGLLTAAPCDVLIYQPAKSADVKRIVMLMNGASAGRAATAVGAQLAEQRGIPAEAVFAVKGSDLRDSAQSALDRVLAELENGTHVEGKVVEAENTAKAILARSDEHALLVTGVIDRPGDPDQWFDKSVGEILADADGPVLVTTSLRRLSAPVLSRWFASRVAWLRPLMTRPEREEVLSISDSASRPSLDYVVLIVISAMIATLGLLLDSSAVVIGAMLIAPLMQPLIATAAGFAAPRFPTALHGLWTLVVGIAAALLVAGLLGVLTATTVPTQEMLNRGAPSLPDAFVALASGFIGAYAMARKDIPSAAVGVAIAASLMPPLCTVGLAAVMGESALASGAALLFFVNIVCIVSSTALVLTWLGMAQGKRERQFARVSLAVLASLSIFAIYQIVILTQSQQEDEEVAQLLRDGLAPAEVVDIETTEGDTLEFLVTLRVDSDQPLPDADQLLTPLTELSGQPVVLRLIPEYVYTVR
ncbi:MAG: DUF389 domain-containing protein [Chloroflexi bacterium]|nr:DUF389 domain-containing protein [Chloroflexota bacterium]